MLLRIGTLRLNVGSLGPCAQESQREKSRWSLVLGLTLSYTQLLEKEISGQKEKKEQRKRGEEDRKKGRERRKEEDRSLVRKHNKAIERL